jgi:hypothetical protein
MEDSVSCGESIRIDGFVGGTFRRKPDYDDPARAAG